MEKNKLKRAYFINGGAGRVLCSVPALERRLKTDKDFIIVCDRRDEVFIGTELYERSFNSNHNRLFEDYLQDRQIIELEPYQLNEYYTQKCSLINAFDILINGSISKEKPNINISLSSEEQVFGYSTIESLKRKYNKDKVLVIQPFGSTIQKEGPLYWDNSGRSIEYANIFNIVKEISKDFIIVYMGEIPFEKAQELGVAIPDKLTIRQWFSIIKSSQGFIGCDSLGQHVSFGFDIPSVVVTGGTSPINITYKESDTHIVYDMGKDKRKYSPIRITNSITSDRNNDGIMYMDTKQENKIIESVYKMTNTTPSIEGDEEVKLEEKSCCSPDIEQDICCGAKDMVVNNG